MTTCDKCSAVLPSGLAEWAGRCDGCIGRMFAGSMRRAEPDLMAFADLVSKVKPCGHPGQSPLYLDTPHGRIQVTADPSVPPNSIRIKQSAVDMSNCELLIESLKEMRAEIAKDRPVDPLDVEYDGVGLRNLVEMDLTWKRERQGMCCSPQWWSKQNFKFTPAQRAAVSAHWSAELRAKVAASKAAERNQVTYCEED